MKKICKNCDKNFFVLYGICSKCGRKGRKELLEIPKIHKLDGKKLLSNFNRNKRVEKS